MIKITISVYRGFFLSNSTGFTMLGIISRILVVFNQHNSKLSKLARPCMRFFYLARFKYGGNDVKIKFCVRPF